MITLLFGFVLASCKYFDKFIFIFFCEGITPSFNLWPGVGIGLFMNFGWFGMRLVFLGSFCFIDIFFIPLIFVFKERESFIWWTTWLL